MGQEKKMLLELICDKQIELLLMDGASYSSERYKQLEGLKLFVKDIGKEQMQNASCETQWR